MENPATHNIKKTIETLDLENISIKKFAKNIGYAKKLIKIAMYLPVKKLVKSMALSIMKYLK